MLRHLDYLMTSSGFFVTVFRKTCSHSLGRATFAHFLHACPVSHHARLSGFDIEGKKRVGLLLPYRKFFPSKANLKARCGCFSNQIYYKTLERWRCSEVFD